MAKKGVKNSDYTVSPRDIRKERKASVVGIVIACIIIIFLISMVIILFSSSFKKTGANTAIIDIHGEIFTGSAGSNPTGAEATYSDDVISYIKDAEKNKNVKAIFFDIDSPGGSAVASQEIGDAIKSARQKGLLTVAYVQELGASGAYWVASSCDYIVATPLSVIGSIGVIGSYLDYAGLLEEFNVTYERLVGGQYKDIGSPYTELTPNERVILQNMINEVYDDFVNEVSTNRNISLNRTYELANGMVYLGEDAKQLGLIDKVGTKDDAFAYIAQKKNITVKTYTYSSDNGLLGLYEAQSQADYYWVGKGIGICFS